MHIVDGRLVSASGTCMSVFSFLHKHYGKTQRGGIFCYLYGIFQAEFQHTERRVKGGGGGLRGGRRSASKEVRANRRRRLHADA